jgi:hypothetical protein
MVSRWDSQPFKNHQTSFPRPAQLPLTRAFSERLADAASSSSWECLQWVAEKFGNHRPKGVEPTDKKKMIQVGKTNKEFAYGDIQPKKHT